MLALWIAIGVVVVILLWLVFAYNKLVRLRNEAEQGFSGIDVQLKRRADLIPNLVETVKAYAAHEREVFERVAEARSQALARARSRRGGQRRRLHDGRAHGAVRHRRGLPGAARRRRTSSASRPS